MVTKISVFVQTRAFFRGGTYVKEKVSPEDITNFYDYVPSLKQELYEWIKPRLTAAGFSFDASGWKWSVEKTEYKIELWVTITWTDMEDTPKKEFMYYYKKTGIENFNPIIVKPYS